jgi:hypothetical protein
VELAAANLNGQANRTAVTIAYWIKEVAIEFIKSSRRNDDVQMLLLPIGL